MMVETFSALLLEASHIGWGPVAFIAIHVMLAVLLLPCSPMTLAAGALWGPWEGLLYSMTGVLLSGMTTFHLGRRAREPVMRWLERRRPNLLRSIEALLIRTDWRIIVVVNLSPVFPAASMGYAFGFSQISAARYLAWTALSLLPLQVPYVLFGHGVRDHLDGGSIWFWALGFAVPAMLLLSWIRRQPWIPKLRDSRPDNE